ncbi:hypothetical protein IAT40_003355 [Kwoniella sp. CBS 6097]
MSVIAAANTTSRGSSSTPHRPPHILTVPISARSHLRQNIQLLLNLLSLHPILVITILVTCSLQPVVKHELDLHRCYRTGRKYKHRIRVDCVGEHGEEGEPFIESRILKDAVENTDALDQYLCPGYGHKAGKEAVVNPRNEKGGEAEESFGKVGLIICDMFNPFIRPAVRARGSSIPVFIFYPTLALSIARYVLPTSDGGTGEHMMERYKTLKDLGVDEEVACRRAFRFIENKLFDWPNLPPMYDPPQSESRPCDVSFIQTISTLHTTLRNSDSDGLITFGFEEFEKESLDLIEDVLGVPVLGVGPQFSEETWQVAEEESHEEETHDAMTFLDECLKRHGSESTAFISFGTVFWPTLRPSLIENIITSLLTIEPPMPFIWATASVDGRIPVHLKSRIEESGRGKVFEWVPQMKVLKHPAVGVFMTHAGYGSLTEAIIAGVPILTLPFIGDQPALSAHFTKIRKIGIQLDQLTSASSYPLTMGDGTVVHGTEEAILAQLKDAWERSRARPTTRELEIALGPRINGGNIANGHPRVNGYVAHEKCQGSADRTETERDLWKRNLKEVKELMMITCTSKDGRARKDMERIFTYLV